MTPEEHLANVQMRFDAFVDRILTQGPPAKPWTHGDATALLSPGSDIATELVDALVDCAKNAVDAAVAVEYKKRAAALPSQFDFFVQTMIGHWRRVDEKRPKKSFGEIIAERGLLDPQTVRRPNDVSKTDPPRSDAVRNFLEDLSSIRERDAAERAARLGFQFIDLNRTPIEPGVKKCVPEHICRRYTIVPVKIDEKSTPNKLLIAVADIRSSMSAIDDVRLISRCLITPVLASRTDIENAIDKLYGSHPRRDTLFVDRLLERSLITPEQLKQAQDVQQTTGSDIAEVLIDLDFVEEREIVAARADTLGIWHIDLRRIPIDQEAIVRVPADVCRRFLVYPIAYNLKAIPEKLLVAVGDDPYNIGGLEEVMRHCRCQITPVLAMPREIDAAIDRAYGKPPQD